MRAQHRAIGQVPAGQVIAGATSDFVLSLHPFKDLIGHLFG
jgi:hypothetical protein